MSDADVRLIVSTYALEIILPFVYIRLTVV